MDEETVKKSIKELGKIFQDNPLNFTVESSLVAELQRIIRNNSKEDEVSVSAEYRDFESEIYDQDYTNYKEDYVQSICDPGRIQKIQIEVNFGTPSEKQGEGKNRLIDLAVLREDSDIRLIDGTKYFLPKSIEHAVEVKFIKNKNIPPKELEKVEEDGYSTDNDNFLARDLNKLTGNKSKSNHLVIFSNKNIFQMKNNGYKEEEIEDGKFTKEARRRYRKLKTYCEDNDIELYHFFPKVKDK